MEGLAQLRFRLDCAQANTKDFDKRVKL